jgi:hypothetical protein
VRNVSRGPHHFHLNFSVYKSSTQKPVDGYSGIHFFHSESLPAHGRVVIYARKNPDSNAVPFSEHPNRVKSGFVKTIPKKDYYI